jgi:hypothetical protein
MCCGKGNTMTLKEYFENPRLEDVSELLERISYGQYPDLPRWKLERYENWEALVTQVKEVVDEFGDTQFVGPATCALVMDMVMKRLKKSRGIFAPAPWVPVMRQLRTMAELQRAAPPAPESGLDS